MSTICILLILFTVNVPCSFATSLATGLDTVKCKITSTWSPIAPPFPTLDKLTFLSQQTGWEHSFINLTNTSQHMHMHVQEHFPTTCKRTIRFHQMLFLYWAIQVGLTAFTFARHRLTPLAAFTSGAYFLHNGRRWQWICKFYTANFKGIFGGP